MEEKSKSDKKIRPISDANATILADSYFFRESAMLDGSALRFALDDSDNEDVMSSKTTLSTVAGENGGSNHHSENSITASAERVKDFEENLSINDSLRGSTKSLMTINNEIDNASDIPPGFNNLSFANDISQGFNNLSFENSDELIPKDMNEEVNDDNFAYV